ncbi:hypothetical protein SELMODRAFT_409485 [Selaginella moellendorffii]|uniref:Uncharacterized protein n=1 Tax=Selaginella moellendorffii TaxID=88036 RepID=D8RBL4_SELML|nr:hypothetical protein SELMODRAFT_409485 [Selaginella moellendorffii]
MEDLTGLSDREFLELWKRKSVRRSQQPWICARIKSGPDIRGLEGHISSGTSQLQIMASLAGDSMACVSCHRLQALAATRRPWTWTPLGISTRLEAWVTDASQGQGSSRLSLNEQSGYELEIMVGEPMIIYEVEVLIYEPDTEWHYVGGELYLRPGTSVPAKFSLGLGRVELHFSSSRRRTGSRMVDMQCLSRWRSPQKEICHSANCLYKRRVTQKRGVILFGTKTPSQAVDEALESIDRWVDQGDDEKIMAWTMYISDGHGRPQDYTAEKPPKKLLLSADKWWKNKQEERRAALKKWDLALKLQDSKRRGGKGSGVQAEEEMEAHETMANAGRRRKCMYACDEGQQNYPIGL